MMREALVLRVDLLLPVDEPLDLHQAHVQGRVLAEPSPGGDDRPVVGLGQHLDREVLGGEALRGHHHAGQPYQLAGLEGEAPAGRHPHVERAVPVETVELEPVRIVVAHPRLHVEPVPPEHGVPLHGVDVPRVPEERQGALGRGGPLGADLRPA